MADSVRGVRLLQHELAKEKESLKDVDENIKKLTGRDPTESRGQQRAGPQRRVVGFPGGANDLPIPRGRDSRIGNRLFNLARQGMVEDGPSPAKRRPTGGAFARLGPRPRMDRGQDSGDDDDLPNKPSVQSSVVATPQEIRTRQKSMEEQAKDSEGRARNRRMFGHIIGTLRRFKDDAKHSKDKEEQRKEIEKKLDDKFKQEKDEIIKERKQLFEDRKQKQIKIRLLEQKMELAENHDGWEKSTRKLENFIRTKSKPHIFYMPRSLIPATQTKVAETKRVIDKIIEDQRRKLEEDIDELMSHRAIVADDEEEDGEEEETVDKTYSENKENKRKIARRDRPDSQPEDNDRDRSNDRKDIKTDRQNSRDNRDGEQDRNRRHSKDETSNRDRRRSSSGKGHSDRQTSGDHSDADEKSHSHHSKPRRRSKGESKSERKEKVWEPMEDENDDEDDNIVVDKADKADESGRGETGGDPVEMGEVRDIQGGEGTTSGIQQKDIEGLGVKVELVEDEGQETVSEEMGVANSVAMSEALVKQEDTEMDYEG